MSVMGVWDTSLREHISILSLDKTEIIMFEAN